MPKNALKNGAVIGFVSSAMDPTCFAINVFTMGIPGYSAHHVGIACNGLVYESTSSGRPPCAITEYIVNGVQAHTLEELSALLFYTGIWMYPLSKPLYAHEVERLQNFLDTMLGRNYDKSGAVHSGGLVFSFLSTFFNDEDLSSLFCSELVAASLAQVGVLPTDDASKWSPNKLIRYLRRKGLCRKPIRLK